MVVRLPPKQLAWVRFLLRQLYLLFFIYGRLAQRLGHLVYTEGIGGSNPSPTTDDLLPCSTTVVRFAVNEGVVGSNPTEAA